MSGVEQVWTTAGLPEHERFAYWREVACRVFVELVPERRDRVPFEGSVRTAPLAAIDVSRINSVGQRVRRTEAAIERTPEPVIYANVQISGSSAARQDGRRAFLLPGDITLVDALRPFELETYGRFEQLSFHLPRVAMLERLAGCPAATAVAIRSSSPYGRMAFAMLREAAGCARDAEKAEAAALADHVAGTVALAVRGAAVGAPPAGSRRRAAHVQAILDEILRRLGDTELAPSSVAASVGISTRYLYALLAERGTTFGRIVRRRRLEACRRDLCDPALRHWTVTDVALRWGFANASHFARVYRQTYGIAPSADRPAARAGGAGGFA